MAAYPETDNYTFYGPFNPWSLLPLFTEHKRVLHLLECNYSEELEMYLYEIEYSLGWRQ